MTNVNMRVIRHDPDCDNAHIYDTEGKWVGYQPGCKVEVLTEIEFPEEVVMWVQEAKVGGCSVEEASDHH